MKLLVKCKLSKSGNLYHVLCADLGYRVVNLTLDRSAISEVANITLSQIYSMKVDDVFTVGELVAINK